MRSTSRSTTANGGRRPAVASCSRAGAAPGGLLIFSCGSLHSVECLDAVVKVEGFGGPGGLDGFGVGVGEAVDFLDALPGGLEVAESVGEGDVGVPVLTWGAVGHGELPAVS